MTLGPQLQPNDQDEQASKRSLRRLALVLLILLGSFGCMLLAGQIARSGLRAKSLERDVRSRVEVDYGAGERLAAPLVPQVIEAVKQDVGPARPTEGVQDVTVVPVVEIPDVTPTAIAQITPTPSPTPTAPPAPTATQTPTDTSVALATATNTPAPSDTPNPTSTATPTNTTVPPIGTATPTGTSQPPTVSPTPAETSLPPTETATPTEIPPLPTFTSTAAPPSDTNTPTPSDTPTPTDTPTATSTFTPVPPPVVAAIVPNEMTRGSSSDPDIDITILGENFLDSVARLGQSLWINVTSVASTIIAGTLSPDVPAGIYALTVENSDGQQGNLSRALTVYPRSSPTTTLDSDVAYISTFGADAAATEGDHDHVQIIFFEVLDGPNDPLDIQIFDADTGGAYDKLGLDGAFGDTVMTYTLRGGAGAYTEPDARSDRPGSTGIESGSFIIQHIVGVDSALDDNPLTLSVSRNQGELVGGSRIFKLVVQGADGGDDSNWYQVSISSSVNPSIEAEARIFAFSWCVALPNPGDEVGLYPFVPVNTTAVTQFNFDFDVSPGAAITLTTPLRNLSVSDISLSGDGETAFQDFGPVSGERATTWSARYVSGSFSLTSNHFSLWFLGDSTTPLAIFTEPTLVSPPIP